MTVQFMQPDGNEIFQVSGWMYKGLDLALGEGVAAGNAGDQPIKLRIVHAYDGDLFRLAFVKNGIGYSVQTVKMNATSTLDILKSWAIHLASISRRNDAPASKTLSGGSFLN